MTHDELEQRLWELEYGLLPGPEAVALREQIANDSELATLQDRVRSRIGLVTDAGKIEMTRIPLPNPSEQLNEIPLRSASVPNQSPFTAAKVRRIASWTAGIAASLLVAFLGWAAWSRPARQTQQLTVNTTESTLPRTVIELKSPQRISRETQNQLILSTSTSEGTPQSVPLLVKMEDVTGKDVYFKEITTDERGRAVVELPSAEVDVTRLTVARANDVERGLQLDLTAAPTEYATHLSTDKPHYRPGDVVRYRSVTLTRFGLKADRELPVEFTVTDPAGQDVASAKLAGTTEQGVGNGDLALPGDSAPGRYTLLARSPQNLFAESRLDFAVQKPTPRQFDIDVNWESPRFAGESPAAGKLAVRTPGGEAAAGVKVNVRGFVDGKQLESSTNEVTTDAAGQADFSFALPPQIASSEGDLGVQAGQQDVWWSDIPLQPNQVLVDFYPEGGDLVAGVENRVYFHCHDFSGKAVAVQGKVLANGQQVIAELATQHEGRGSFRFTPQLATNYSVKVDDPPAIQSIPTLPAITEQGRIALDAGSGVFAADSPLGITLRANAGGPPSDFSLVANCRGVIVGQQSGSASDFTEGTCQLRVPIVADAAGVIRVTLFDYSRQTPEPLAERLVYRHPQKKVRLQFSGLSREYASGDTVHGEVLASDENGSPIAAVLGLSAIDETVLELADHVPARMPTQFLLLGDVERADKLEDANFYLSSDSSAATALDLFLGTQGWRRFERYSYGQMAGGGSAGGGSSVRESLASRSAERLGEARLRGTEVFADDGAAMTSFGAIGSQQLVEPSAEAPLQFDNRDVVAKFVAPPSNAAAEYAPDVLGTPPADWPKWLLPVSSGLLLVVLFALIVRWQPTKRVLVGAASAMVILGLVSAVVWRTVEGKSDRGFVAPSAPPSADVRTAEPADTLSIESKNEPSSGEKVPASPELDAPVPNSAPVIADPKPSEQLPKIVEEPAPAPAAPAPAIPPVPAPMSRSAADAIPPDAAAPAEQKAAPAPFRSMSPAKPGGSAEGAEAAKATSGGFGGGLGGMDQKQLRDKQAGAAPRAELDALNNRLEKNRLEKNRLEKNRLEKNRLERNRLERKATETDSRSIKKLKSESESADKRIAEKEGADQNLPLKASLGQKENGGARISRSGSGMGPPPPAARSGVQNFEAPAQLGEHFIVRRFAHVRPKPDLDLRRNDFTETVLWNPLFFTDADGKGTFAFDLPDTVTQFRILAEGHHDGRLGSAGQSISTRTAK